MSFPPAPTDPLDSARYKEAVRFLHSRINYERIVAIPYRADQWKLERMQELLARLGNPQQGMPIVHVAGTKGKGSTAAMIAAILTASGHCTALFTSPHVERIEERLAVDGQRCEAEAFADLIDAVRPAVESMDRDSAKGLPNGPTFFETLTAMAFLHADRRRADAMVLEVGLGGRLDSTNVCWPTVSVITSISFDHMKQLGDSLSQIAREKAGIIKPGVPVVSGVAQPEPRDVIRKTCRGLGCRLLEAGVDFDSRYTAPQHLETADSAARVDYRRLGGNQPSGASYRGIELGLLGKHQAANAALAIATVCLLAEQQGWRIGETSIRQALGGLRWPARVELIRRKPAIVIDAAHNVASAQALLDVLEESFQVDRRILVFATTQEKDVRGMLACLIDRFDEVILTRYLNSPRAFPLEDLESVARQVKDREYRICPTPDAAWQAVRSIVSPGDLVCVTGSFFIAGQMERVIRREGLPLNETA
jgi:dihydrofolate synthase/folylpolyglutamate synthase